VREWNRKGMLNRLYGLTPQAYATMLERQGGRCAICSHAETAMNRDGRMNPLAVDHDHETRAVRALLCSRCNRGLGLFKDDPELLIQAAAYLARHGKPVGAEAENMANQNPEGIQ
jgi:hypothetical protein